VGSERYLLCLMVDWVASINQFILSYAFAAFGIEVNSTISYQKKERYISISIDALM